jgi:hypothetical protein
MLGVERENPELVVSVNNANKEKRRRRKNLPKKLPNNRKLPRLRLPSVRAAEEVVGKVNSDYTRLLTTLYHSACILLELFRLIISSLSYLLRSISSFFLCFYSYLCRFIAFVHFWLIPLINSNTCKVFKFPS